MTNLPKNRTLVALLVVAIMLVLAGPTFARPEAQTEWAPGYFDRAAAAQEHRSLSAALAGEAAHGGRDIAVAIAADRLAEVEKAQTVGGRLQVGLVEPLDVGVDLSKAASLASKGVELALGAIARRDSGWVWTTSVSSPGASAMRLHFSDFSLPAGAEMYLYTGREAFGPYSGLGPLGDGDFWSHTLVGSSIQVQVRGLQKGAKGAGAKFRISELGHMGPDFKAALFGPAGDEKSFCSFNASCVNNAECSSVPAAIKPAQDAVAHMLFRSGGFYYICSGGLVADTDGSTQKPYFLTAHHCISKGSEASSLENFFRFTTPCNGTCYDPDGVTPRTLGASIMATGTAGDYTLMLLAENAPAGSAFLGWSSSPVANTNGAPLYRISHPKGAPQAYSEQDVDTNAGTCRTLARGNFIYSRDTYGGTEGGSSGSPVLNANGQVVGQLYGACGTNVNDSCDSGSNATVDGAMASYFPNVAAFLDPSPGGPTCSAAGASCSNNSDCCSNSCKGKPGGKTCK